MQRLCAIHDAAVRMIDTSVICVLWHGACVAKKHPPEGTGATDRLFHRLDDVVGHLLGVAKKHPPEGTRRQTAYSIALTMSSVIFLASPNSIIVLSRKNSSLPMPA